MAHRTKEIREAVKAALLKAGATDLSFSLCGDCHQRYDFKVDGVDGRFTFSSTPRSSQAIWNAEAFAKRTVREYRDGTKGQRKATTQASMAGGHSPALPRRQGFHTMAAAGRGA
jgi:formate-dependent nitrite reductase cytochrome c552 subunit